MKALRSAAKFRTSE